jgi:hypothetical protein
MRWFRHPAWRGVIIGLGTEVLLSAATHAEIRPRAAEEMGCARTPVEVKVKGKDERLLLYPVSLV